MLVGAMIVIASLHDKRHHAGTVYAVTMRPIGTLPLIECLRPTRDLVHGVKYRGMSGEWYTDRYRALLRSRWPAVRAWLDSLSAERDMTLVCFCAAGVFCHRRLIAQMLAIHRRDLEVVVVG